MPLLEGHLKRRVVEKDVGILELAVEAALHPVHAKEDTVAVLVSGKDQYCCSDAARTAAIGEGI